MDKSQLNKVLGLIKLYLKNKKPKDYDGNPYEDYNVPQPVLSLGLDERFVKALMYHNIDSFDDWGKMGEDLKIPKLNTFDVSVDWTGNEYLTRRYGHRIEGYDEYDIQQSIYDCDPCYYDGDETYAEVHDSEGDINITDIEQITEEDINRIVKKVLR
jgi:hypothetical protein